MLIYLAITSTALVVLAVLGLMMLRRSVDVSEQLVHEIQELRLTSRTRINQAAVQSGAVDEEQKLVRLGRASIGRRVVVGGDDDSQQKKDLTTQVVFDEETDRG